MKFSLYLNVLWLLFIPSGHAYENGYGSPERLSQAFAEQYGRYLSLFPKAENAKLMTFEFFHPSEETIHVSMSCKGENPLLASMNKQQVALNRSCKQHNDSYEQQCPKVSNYDGTKGILDSSKLLKQKEIPKDTLLSVDCIVLSDISTAQISVTIQAKSKEGISKRVCNNSCRYSYDGACDETYYCQDGTDCYDCGSSTLIEHQVTDTLTFTAVSLNERWYIIESTETTPPINLSPKRP